MSVTDPIADLLTRIRNGQMAKHDKVDMPFSKLKFRIISILKDEGYIKNYKEIDVKGAFPVIRVYLKYGPDGRPLINGLKRISKPGRRVYRGADELPSVLKGLGISILTTNRGVMTSHQAKREGVGGEVLCNVW